MELKKNIYRRWMGHSRHSRYSLTCGILLVLGALWWMLYKPLIASIARYKNINVSLKESIEQFEKEKKDLGRLASAIPAMEYDLASYCPRVDIINKVMTELIVSAHATGIYLDTVKVDKIHSHDWYKEQILHISANGPLPALVIWLNAASLPSNLSIFDLVIDRANESVVHGSLNFSYITN